VLLAIVIPTYLIQNALYCSQWAGAGVLLSALSWHPSFLGAKENELPIFVLAAEELELSLPR
jgi:hypothetical protein